MRQLVLAQRDFDFHARIGIVADDLDHAPHRLGITRRLGQKFNHHHLAGLGLHRAFRFNQDFLADTLFFSRYIIDATLGTETPDQTGIHMFQYFNNLAFWPAAPIHANLAHQHAIAMQDFVHLFRAKIQIIATGIGNQKAKTIAMALHPSGNQFDFGRQAQRALAVDHQLAFALHRLQAALESFDFCISDAQHRDQFIGKDRRTALFQDLQDKFARRQRVFVTLTFSCQERIFGAQAL